MLYYKPHLCCQGYLLISMQLSTVLLYTWRVVQYFMPKYDVIVTRTMTIAKTMDLTVTAVDPDDAEKAAKAMLAPSKGSTLDDWEWEPVEDGVTETLEYEVMEA